MAQSFLLLNILNYIQYVFKLILRSFTISIVAIFKDLYHNKEEYYKLEYNSYLKSR